MVTSLLMNMCQVRCVCVSMCSSYHKPGVVVRLTVEKPGLFMCAANDECCGWPWFAFLGALAHNYDQDRSRSTICCETFWLLATDFLELSLSFNSVSFPYGQKQEWNHAENTSHILGALILMEKANPTKSQPNKPTVCQPNGKGDCQVWPHEQ